MSLEINQLEYRSLAPDGPLTEIVESIWMVKNHAEEKRKCIIVPDGKIDLFFFFDEADSFDIIYTGSEEIFRNKTDDLKSK